MKIAICDDDTLCRETVFQVVTEYIEQGNREISVASFERASDLMEDSLRIGGYDIYILDILMPRTNGIELGLQLRDAGFDSKILYLTSSTDYAIAAFKAKASDYLLKPIKKEELFSALDEAITSLVEKREKGLVVKTRDSTLKLSFDSILYAELDKKAVVYHLVNGKTIKGVAIRTSFAEAVQEMLRDNRFTMCGASMVVNLYYINVVDNDILIFKTGHKTYISKRNSRELRSVWSNFWFNEGGCK